MDKLKIFDLVLTDEVLPNGKKKYKVNFIAFTPDPAIEESWIAMANESLTVKFEAIDEEKRIVMGPYMVADKPILRLHPKTKEPFLVKMTADTIDKIMFQIFDEGYQKNSNDNHTDVMLDGITLYQSWAINRALGINPPTNWPDLTDGSAMGVWKVNNESVWADIKAGKYTGPSIEGYLKLVEVKEITEEDLNELLDETQK